MESRQQLQAKIDRLVAQRALVEAQLQAKREEIRIRLKRIELLTRELEELG